MKKAISPIIGIILILLITLTISGSAYVFLSGLYESQTAKTIKIVTGSVNDRYSLIQNVGTSTVQMDELYVTVDGQNVSFTITPDSIPSGRTSRLNITDLSISGNSLRVMVAGPTNAVSYYTEIEP